MKKILILIVLLGLLYPDVVPQLRAADQLHLGKMASVQILKPGHLLPSADAAPQHWLLGGGVVSGERFFFAEHGRLLSFLIL
jgi:hypothetical protein